MIRSIKRRLKSITPVFLMDIYRSMRPRKKLDIDGLNTKEVFSKIYKEHYWSSDESISGPGSDPLQTNSIKAELEEVFREFNISSILDAPCGDFGWMQKVNLNGIQYTGMDIVDQLIQNNKTQFQDLDNVEFRVGNIIEDELPQVDLILCRDCLVHFSYEDIRKTIENFKKSGSRYLLTTSFIHHQNKQDIPTGYWRPINLQQAPFNLPDPILVIDEKCTEGGGKHKDKSLLMWEVKNIFC